MQRVFVLSADRKPLDPCRPARARRLLRQGKAAVLRRYPFTIILRHRTAAESVTHDFRVKIDPGSKTTGIALVDDKRKAVVFAAEVEHRGEGIKRAMVKRAMLRRSRRGRKTRYREPRFNNRRRREGWLPPSLESRVANVTTWVERLRRFAPVAAISVQLAKFDTQKMENPEIRGVEYQQGELQGYEVREYLLEKWGRKCAYCGAEGVPLEVEHITPRVLGGSNRVSNLCLACGPCNRKKGERTAAQFGHTEVQERAKKPLRDAAAINATRWALFGRLKETGLPVECGTGARTKFNRCSSGYPKEHWIEAACVGVSGEGVRLDVDAVPLQIKATGRGKRQRCRPDKYGFPKVHSTRRKVHFGFQTGDIVRAVVPSGKHQGTHEGRVVVRASGSFNIQSEDGLAHGSNHRYCLIKQRSDGYTYAKGGGASSHP